MPESETPAHLELTAGLPAEPRSQVHAGEHGEELVALGGQLRQLRAARNLSLKVVAEACGITASMLSQVERGLVAPSLNTLYTLSSYYKVGLFELFLDEQIWDPGQVIRRAERRKVSFPGSTETYDVLTPTGQRAMSVLELVVPPDRGQFKHGLSHEGEECAVVVSGSATLNLGNVVHELFEGDSIYYEATVPHQFECRGPETATVLLFMTPAI